MARAKKLPSGNWRVQIFSHTDGAGKRHYESFTASTKHEAEMLAAQFKAKKERRIDRNYTLAECIDGYITAKTGVLSPSTIRSYRQMQATRYDSIKNIRLKKVCNEDLQLFVSRLAGKVGAKTVSNVYGLLTASIAMYAPELTFHVTLPSKSKPRQTAPSDDAVASLFNAANPTIKKCIALSAFGSLRRGEICALTYADLNGNVLSISRDMVIDEHRKWVTKDIPKTSDSIRTVAIPDAVVQLLGSGAPTDRIITVLPSTITTEFVKLRNRLGISMRFHDLRHYYASIGAALNIPDTYLAAFGGWRQGSSVLKTVYQNQITPIANGYARKMTDHFDNVLNLCNTKCNSENKKAAE